MRLFDGGGVFVLALVGGVGEGDLAFCLLSFCSCLFDLTSWKILLASSSDDSVAMGLMPLAA